ncbi:axin-2 isoform X6 [Mirounga angustirostris]|uniref:axin-2 isoform X6 n=1 Tax=Mirounga angustirostris TaxID=9716 RepID=UPI00313D8B93
MHRSVKANGQVSLPHFPRTHRLPKEMTPVEPATFAAELISRLEKLKLELESRHSLEERLQQIREDEEREASELALSPRDGGPAPHPLSLLPSGSYEEDPQTILDDHLSRVLKTPGCQSPGVGRYSPRSRSPDHHHHQEQYHPLLPPGGKLPPVAAPQAGCPLLGARGLVTKQTTKHVHHHYIHHHGLPKTREEMEAEAAQRVRCFCPGGAGYYCYPKCRSHPKAVEPAAEQFGNRGSALPKRSGKSVEPGLALPAREGGAPGGAGALQLPGEEGDRSQDVWQWMLESERQSKPKPPSAQSTKKAYPLESARASPAERAGRHHLLGGSSGHARSAPRAPAFTQDPAMPPLTPPNTLAQLEEACRRLAEVSKPPKQRYYFKKASDEFACGAVFEEIWDDEAVLPMYEGRILGKVERID